MTTPDPDDETSADELATLNPPLHQARSYWHNAQAIGQPGQPSMTEAAELQRQHADMARTAALIAMMESLHTIERTITRHQRRNVAAVGSLETLAKEVTKLRYIARRP